jgi:chorismate synthase
MAGSSFGTEFKITTFGESHGEAIGVVIDGVTPGVELDAEDIQRDLDRRKPGQSDVTTPRKEADKVHILSGVFEGKTTGTPIMLTVYNENSRSKDYSAVKDLFRPGHADFTFQKKYGIRDYRGGGRSSGRETIGRVAAGAVAKKILSKYGIEIVAYTKEAAGVVCEKLNFDEIENNIVRACDPDAAKLIIEKIIEARNTHNSVGGIVECRINGVPAGLGEPVFDKLDADLAKAMLSIGAVKGFEVGAGFKVAQMTGKENNDEMDSSGFLTNNSGGILGGISNGNEILFRVAFKPTPSIASAQKTIDKDENELECETHGRHDPSIFPRAVPVVEAMAAIVIADHIKRQTALLA